MATLIKQGNTLKVSTPYNKAFVELLKEKVPAIARSWQKPYWIVDSKYLAQVRELAELHFDYVDVWQDVPQAFQARQTLLIEYLGRCKADGFNVTYANGFANGAWSVRFSEKVLREYFEGAHETQAEQMTFYGLLGAKQTASQDELKRAYFRAAKVWHPDLNKDADATEMFKKVKEAWDTLENPLRRAKYDVGLKLMAAVETNVPSWRNANLATVSDYGYRAPAMCGRVDLDLETGVRQTVKKILDWRDDVKTIGGIQLIRVAFWKKGDANFTTRWEQL